MVNRSRPSFRQWQSIMRAPLPPICGDRVLDRSYRWAGVGINRPIPVEGHRVSAITPEDEEAYKALRDDDWLQGNQIATAIQLVRD